MIVAMTKYQFLVYHKQYDAFLQELRDLGMVHVVQQQTGELAPDSPLAIQLQDYARLEAIAKEMTQLLGGSHEHCAAIGETPLADIVERFDQLQKKKAEQLQQQMTLEKELHQLQPWGDFSWESVQALTDAGYVLRFYSVAQRNWDEAWVDQYNAMVITNDGIQVYFVTLTPSAVVVEMNDVERVTLPEASLSQLQASHQALLKEAEALEKEIYQFAVTQYMTLEQGIRQAQEAIDYTSVKLNTVSTLEDKVCLLEGWVPQASKEQINLFLDKEGVVYTQQDATRNDYAPSKLSNNAFARLFHPITELYDMPSYGEVDLTPFFAPFFVLFFGLCLGDAGYGLLLLIGGLIARTKVKPAMKSYMSLVAIFGLGTMICGTISGTFFGIPLLEVDWPWIQRFKVLMFNPDQLFTLSLAIGVVQIIFGMFIKAIGQTIRFGLKNVLSTWGWILILVGCGGTYALQSQGIVAPEVAQWIYYLVGGVGGLFVFILNDVTRNPLVNIGAGLWDSYNMATGLLGDILSYVRLFALGISGSVLGLVFNDLAREMSPDIPVVGFLVSAIILFLGHSMNIFMSGLGAFVHPMRLTFVEFYKNAGFEGGGQKFHPFARVKKED